MPAPHPPGFLDLGFARGVLLAAVSAGLVACGGGGGTPVTVSPPLSTEPRAEALAASQPGELLSFVRSRARLRWNEAVDRQALGAPSLVATPSSSATPRSSTTVQEAGVDESDLIKSAGDLIVTISGVAGGRGGAETPRVLSHRRLGDGTVQALDDLSLAGDGQRWAHMGGLLWSASEQRAAVVGEVYTPYAGPLPCQAGPLPGGPSPVADCITPAGTGNATGATAVLGLPFLEPNHSVRVQGVNINPSGKLGAGTRLDISGRLVGTRLINNTLYVVSSHSPRLPTDILPATASPSERDAALARLSLQDVLPTVRVNGGQAQALVADSDCYLQTANASDAVELTTITSIQIGDPALSTKSRCIVGGTEALYLSPTSLVLATTRYRYSGDGTGSSPWRYPPDIRTDLHRFELGRSGGVAYTSSGSVKGHLGWDLTRKAYRLSEHNGDLRVLSYTGENGWASRGDGDRAPASPATLTILRENRPQARLEALATLPNAQRPEALGKPNEQVYGVRFLGDRAYLVTFRQVDPLYVLDLANPDDPRISGVLEVPGFSNDLYPMPNGLLLGVGRNADATTGRLGGVKLSLFDVADPGAPRELENRVLGGPNSQTGLEFSAQGINWLGLPDRVRVALPVLLLDANFSLTDMGLYRIEVDTANRTLVDKPMIRLPDLGSGLGIAQDRSLQIGNHVYYWAQGELLARPW